MSATIHVAFTESQAAAVVLALRCYLEWEESQPGDVKAMSNALDKVNAGRLRLQRHRAASEATS